MMQHPSTARRAAVAATAALALGAGALLAPTAAVAAKPKPKAIKGSLSGTVAMTCAVPAFDAEYPYDAKIKLTGTKAAKAKAISLTATFSEQPGLAPVPVNDTVDGVAVFKLGSKSVTLKGKKGVNVAASSPIPMPPVKGSLKSTGKSFSVTLVKATFKLETFGVEMNCVPTESGTLGTLKLK